MSILSGFLDNPWAPQVIETALNQAQTSRGLQAVNEAFSTPEIDTAIEGLRTDARRYYNFQAERGYGQARRQGRQNIGRAGLTGGSVDVRGRRQNLGEYIQAKQQAAIDADRLGKAAEADIRRLKEAALDRVYQNPTIPVSNNYRQEAFGFIDKAQSNIPAATAGSLFTTAGSVVTAGAQARGQGRTGLGFDFTTPAPVTAPSTPGVSRTGRIT